MIANKLSHFTIAPTVFVVLAVRVRFTSDYVQIFSRDDSQAKMPQTNNRGVALLARTPDKNNNYGNAESPIEGALAIIVGGGVGSTTKCRIFLNENNCASDRIFGKNNCPRCLIKRIAKNADTLDVSYINRLLLCKLNVVQCLAQQYLSAIVSNNEVIHQL